ncbi:alpha/beta fold hydrolase [Nocardia mexicana]|uniref:Pimeloyl-ACP methyl ester carboxylesterase n=1 Tax=Nocardia mexicana TaxID=279262 RepID=A0A370GIV0_9NOCA|nr:alpha/beta hydrolase [Nocardia mexicana]RDI43591.1 pimeloyl-ACP methyl ester carboxylesterase [Nocardia mexicana]
MTRSDACVLTIPATDGVRLAATRTGPPTAAAATVVYIHGLFCDRHYWAPVTTRLHDRLDGAITQITYDHRGHGDSGHPPRTTATTMDRLADDLDIVLTHATGAVVLVAHSAGALIAQAYATRHHARATALSGLVLINAAAEFPSFPRLPAHFRAWPHQLHRLRHTRLDPLAAAGTAILERRFRRASHRHGPKTHLATGTRPTNPRVTADILAAYRAFSLDTNAAHSLRGTPTFVLAGERDPAVPPEQAVRLADKLWSDYEIVPAAGHSLPRTDPHRVTDTIVAALDIAYRADQREPPHRTATDTAHGWLEGPS